MCAHLSNGDLVVQCLQDAGDMLVPRTGVQLHFAPIPNVFASLHVETHPALANQMTDMEDIIVNALFMSA